MENLKAGGEGVAGKRVVNDSLQPYQSEASLVILSLALLNRRRRFLHGNLLQKANAEDDSSLVMRSEYGQKFVCNVPAIPALEREETTENAEALAIGVVADVVAAAFYVRSCIKKVIFVSFHVVYRR